MDSYEVYIGAAPVQVNVQLSGETPVFEIKGATIATLSQLLITQAINNALTNAKGLLNKSVIAIDDNIVVSNGDIVTINSGVVSDDRFVDVTALSEEGDGCLIHNLETSHTLTFIGKNVYLADGETMVENLISPAVYDIKNINGKLIIINGI